MYVDGYMLLAIYAIAVLALAVSVYALWSLEEINENIIIEVYTDCQNIIGLQDRREKLEKNNFLRTHSMDNQIFRSIIHD
jgi:hypothetical protein